MGWGGAGQGRAGQGRAGDTRLTEIGVSDHVFTAQITPFLSSSGKKPHTLFAPVMGAFKNVTWDLKETEKIKEEQKDWYGGEQAKVLKREYSTKGADPVRSSTVSARDKGSRCAPRGSVMRFSQVRDRGAGQGFHMYGSRALSK